MKITEVRIFPTESKDGKLKAFATMTFDDWFVVRNVKVIQGTNGLFVAMPSRKAMDSCTKCGFKNVVGAKFCNQCGGQLEAKRFTEQKEGDVQNDHMDIAHPITQECRVYIQDRILEAYKKEPGAPSDNSGKQVRPSVEQVFGKVGASKLSREASQPEEEIKWKKKDLSGGEEAQDIEL